jgi:hypothetical protein
MPGGGRAAEARARDNPAPRLYEEFAERQEAGRYDQDQAMTGATEPGKDLAKLLVGELRVDPVQQGQPPLHVWKVIAQDVDDGDRPCFQEQFPQTLDGLRGKVREVEAQVGIRTMNLVLDASATHSEADDRLRAQSIRYPGDCGATFDQERLAAL